MYGCNLAEVIRHRIRQYMVLHYMSYMTIHTFPVMYSRMQI
jgi:hypothetical protein